MPSKLHILTLCFAVLLTPMAQAMTLSEESTVRDMLAIDAQIALIKEQKNLREAMGIDTKAVVARATPQSIVPAQASLVTESAKADTEESKESKEDTVAILGIFGLGNALFADIQINNARVRFQQGAPQALGMPAGFPYRLSNIKPPCVSLVHEDNKQTVCLEGVN